MQVAVEQVDPSGFVRHRPTPSQRPSSLQPEPVGHVLPEGGKLPSATGWQMPGLALQVSHLPSHCLLQQTPSIHQPLRHCELVAQPEPLPLSAPRSPSIRIPSRVVSGIASMLSAPASGVSGVPSRDMSPSLSCVLSPMG